MPILSLGPKQFVQGLNPLQRTQAGYGGFFSSLISIDPFRYPGYLAAGTRAANMGNNSVVHDGVGITTFGDIDPSGNLYAIGGSKLHQITMVSGVPTVTNAGSWPHTVSNGADEVKVYALNGTSKLFYFLTTDIGMFDLTSTFDDDWGSTVPTGAGAINNAPHRAKEFNKILYFCNGKYVSSIDGTTATTYLNLTSVQSGSAGGVLQLPANYTARDIKIENGRLNIIATSNNAASTTAANSGESKIFIWDGISTLPDQIVDIDDNYTSAQQSVGGFPHIFTQGRSNGMTIRKKNYWGYQTVQTLRGMTVPPPQSVTTLESMVVFAPPDQGAIFSYGSPFSDYAYRGSDSGGAFPDSLQSQFLAGQSVKAICVYNNCLLAAISDTPDAVYFPFTSNTSWDYGNSRFKTNFIDLPTGSVIEWVKVVFMATDPTTSAVIQPNLYVNGSTVNTTLGTNIGVATADANGLFSQIMYTNSIFADNFSLDISFGGSDSNSIIITRIDVGYHTPQNTV